MNASEFLKSLLTTERKETPSLYEILESVHKASSEQSVNVNKPVKLVKVKHNAARDSFVSFRGLDLFFDRDGLCVTPCYNKEIIEQEMIYRPGCFTFVEEIEPVVEVLTIEEALKELEQEESIVVDETSEEEEPKQVKRGRKGK